MRQGYNLKQSYIIALFGLLAVAVGLLVSYFPPAQNGAAIWNLVAVAVGYGIRDLFVKDNAPQEGQK